MKDKKTKKQEQTTLEPLKARKTKILKEGSYKGIIKNFIRDTEQYDYMRYEIEVIDENIKLQVSYPTDITFLPDGKPSSSHAKFLYRMGLIDFNEESNLNDFIREFVIGKEVTFLIEEKETEKGTFSNIVKSSVKPLI